MKAAALISFVLLNAKVLKILDFEPTNPIMIFTVAIMAGFSERFIVGAIEGKPETQDKSEKQKGDKEK